MTQSDFDKAMTFFDYPHGDKKRTALQLVLVCGATQAAASKATGYSTAQLSTVCRRVHRDLGRVADLTGVNLL